MSEDASFQTLNNLEEQLVELEVLQSMYPGENELEISNPAIVHDIKEYLNKKGSLPSIIEFTLKLEIDCHPVAATFNLPREYPAAVHPQTYIRSERFSREAQSNINRDVQTFIEAEVRLGEPSVMAIISWIQDHADTYFGDVKTEQPKAESTVLSESFSRYWIYSHHIYSKTKRKNILDMAKDYDVTGFCLPGKPGIICIEGPTKNCVDWWGVVRNWNWKRLNIKIQEELEGDIEDCRLFSGFVEIGEVKSGSRDCHMDMGQFQTYLQQHGCLHIFSQLFGIEK